MVTHEALRSRLPYGIWTCPDGREVLFNRDYEPIWERRPGEPARPANRSEKPQQIGPITFYTDDKAPWRDAESLQYCEQVLVEWGVTTAKE